MIIVEIEGIGLRHVGLLPDCKPGNSDDIASLDNDSDQEEEAFWGESDESRKANPGSGIRFSQLASHTEKVDRSISRVLSWTVIHLGLASPQTSSNLPGSSAGHANGSLFGLAPGGVYPATTVASGAVRSYRTFSPLPVPSKGGNRRYLLCGTSRSHTVTSVAPRRYLAPCPVEPGLSSSGYAASDCLTDPGRSLGDGNEKHQLIIENG